MAMGLDDKSMPSLPLRIIHRLAAIDLTLVWIAVEKWQVDNSIMPCIMVPLTSSFASERYDGNKVRQH